MHRHQAKVMTTPFFWNDAIIRVLMLRLGIRPEALALVWGEVHECNSAGPKFVAGHEGAAVWWALRCTGVTPVVHQGGPGLACTAQQIFEYTKGGPDSTVSVG